VDLLGTIARRAAATPAQIALAWLLARKPWIAPIPGTRRLTRLEENTGAAGVELTPDDLTEVETAAAQIQPATSLTRSQTRTSCGCPPSGQTAACGTR